MTIKKWSLIEDDLALVEKRLAKLINAAGPELRSINEYIFRESGKRIRPTLFLIASKRPHNNRAQLTDVAVALELMHTASLVHDDVIDQAPHRRGYEALHVRWNNRVAVLAGDYLLSQVFKTLITIHNWDLMNLVSEIVMNMAEGEIEQALANNGDRDLEKRYLQWIGKKSASFFAGCCRAGSLLSGDGGEEQKHWYEYGYNLGMAFQLIDDLLDYTTDSKQTGKQRFGDLKNRVITLPLIEALRSEQPESKEQIIDYLKNDKISSGDLDRIAKAVMESGGPVYTYDMAVQYTDLARSAVGKIGSADPEIKKLLIHLAGSVLERKK